MSSLTLPALAPGRPCAAAQRKRLGWCVLAVVGVHLTLLFPTLQSADAPASAASRAVQVRLITPTIVAAPAGTPQLQQPGPVAAAAAAVPSPSHVGAVLAPKGGDDTTYLARSALTLAPKARAPVAINYPYFDGEGDQYLGEFDVFIDDRGSVVRVVAKTPQLPGILSAAVRDAFLAARFSPGEVDGRAVRSRLHIEVNFDSRKQPAQ